MYCQKCGKKMQKCIVCLVNYCAKCNLHTKPSLIDRAFNKFNKE